MSVNNSMETGRKCRGYVWQRCSSEWAVAATVWFHVRGHTMSSAVYQKNLLITPSNSIDSVIHNASNAMRRSSDFCCLNKRIYLEANNIETALFTDRAKASYYWVCKIQL